MLTIHAQSIGKATKYLPPNVSTYDHPPAKKSRNGKPEVHITLNFAAAPSVLHFDGMSAGLRQRGSDGH